MIAFALKILIVILGLLSGREPRRPALAFVCQLPNLFSIISHTVPTIC